MSPRIKNKTKPLFGAILTGALALGGLSTNTFAEGSSSYFDANAAQCVVDSYNTEHSTSITTIEQVDFSAVTMLTCRNRSITNIRGLVLMPNLIGLDLSGNNNLSTIDLSQNTELLYLYLSDTNIKRLDISNNPDIISFNPPSLMASGGLVTSAYIEKNDDEVYGYKMDLSGLKFWRDENYTETERSDYQYYDSMAKTVYGKEETIYSHSPVVSYKGADINPRGGQQRDYIMIQDAEESNSYSYFSDYFGPFTYVYKGDELDTNDEIEKFMDFQNKDYTLRFSDVYENYKLSKIVLNDVAGDFTLLTDEETHKTGIHGTEASVNVYYYFDLKTDEDTPTAPNTGFFTNEDGGVNLANIAALFAGISVIAFLSLGITFRIRKHHKASRF